MPETHVSPAGGAEILPFRQRQRHAGGPGRASGNVGAGFPPPLSAPSIGQAEPDNFRHRMGVNLAGLAVALALILAGIWIAEEMAQLRRDQDCVLMNLKSCRQVAARPGEPHR